MYPLFRSILFRLDPERAHALALSLVRLAGSLPGLREAVGFLFQGPALPVRAFGLVFKNPVGLAAGFDKDGLGWRGLALLGFGHVEIGTVTPGPQPGNPRPRLFRLPEDQALINRLGFPGRGAAFVSRRLLSARTSGCLLGVNLGKKKDTPLENAAIDYLNLLQTFAPLADYLSINVSSPNTVGLRRLQAREYLENLLAELHRARQEQQTRLRRPVPLLVKLAPDLPDAELEDALQAILNTSMDGVIAANTTLSRAGVSSPLKVETGGLSGAPVRSLSTEMVRKIYSLTAGKLPVVGVGGVMDASGAQEKLEAGASLVQIYTGLVFRGPGVVKNILEGLEIYSKETETQIANL